MPTVVETTVYTFAEIKAIGGAALKRAIEQVIAWDTSGDWCQWLTQDINHWFTQERQEGVDHGSESEVDPKWRPTYSPFDSGKCGEWDAEYRYCNFEFEVYLPDYMRRKNLHRKYERLYRWMQQSGGYTIKAKVERGRNRDSEFAPMPDDVAEDIHRDIDNGWYAGKDEERNNLMRAQVSEVLKVLAGDAEQVQAKLGHWVHEEWMYRASDEFAEQEAEGLELKFTEDGDIFE